MLNGLLGRAPNSEAPLSVGPEDVKMSTKQAEAVTNEAGVATAAEISGTQLESFLPNRLTQPGLSLAAPRYKNMTSQYLCNSNYSSKNSTNDITSWTSLHRIICCSTPCAVACK